MKTELQCIERASYLFQTAIKCAREYCIEESDRVGRLYYVTPLIAFAITVILSENCSVEVFVFRGREESSVLRQLPCGAFSIRHDRCKSFIERLEHLSVWNKSDCATKSLDGLLCYHVISSVGSEHCFEMYNPDEVADISYRAIVNLYSTEFLNSFVAL